MLGEWYLPPGECQVISTITEGTISISQPESSSAPTRIFQTPLRQTASVDAPQLDHVPRSGGLILYSGPKQASTTRPLSLLARKGLNHDTHPRSARNARPPICDHWPTRLCTAPSGQRAT